jgi:hypothetical protein
VAVVRKQMTSRPAKCPRVPIALFLSAKHDRDGSGSVPASGILWHGADAEVVAQIIRTYSQIGDLVVDLDAHPTVTAVAGFLGRIPPVPVPGRRLKRLTPPAEPAAPNQERLALGDGAALLLAAVSCPDAKLIETSLQMWRTMLRSGGYLIVVAAAKQAVSSGLSMRTMIVQAACTAQLVLCQQLLIVAGVRDVEPLARQIPGRARLLGGRHVAGHRIALVFVAVEPLSR